MVIDASALLAILLSEPENDEFSEAITVAGGGVMSAVNYWEVLARMYRYDGPEGRADSDELIAMLGIHVVAVTAEDARRAADVFARWGRPSPANLNLGDCFAYALSKDMGEPLLYKGSDFALTDVQKVIDLSS